MTNVNIDLKVNMISFLMNNFEFLYGEKNGVEIFKANVEDLVFRNQIPYVVRDIVYSIYGIVNTDVYSPERNAEKLYQIESLLRLYKQGVDRKKFILYLKNGLKTGQISKTAGDIIKKIFEIEDLKIADESKKEVKRVNENDVLAAVDSKKSSKPSTPLRKPAEPKVAKDMNVKRDISKFKNDYVSEIYYEYPNPSYDGCSGSQRYLHTKLIDAINRPNDATFKIYYKISDDGCHASYAYMDVPEAYKKEEPKPMSSSVGCSSGGGYNFGRSC